MNKRANDFNKILASDKYHMLRDTESFLGYQLKRLRAFVACLVYAGR
jgi:hypothetical protein